MTAGRQNTERRRVLHVLGSLHRGGAESTTMDLVAATLRTTDHTVLLLGDTGSADAGGLWDRARALGVDVVRCSLHPRRSFPFRLARQLQAARPEVVVSHVSLFSGLVLLIARWSRVPRRLARVHSTGDGRRPTIPRVIYRSAARALLRASASTLVPVSLAAQEFACGRSRVLARRSVVLMNGVDLDRFRPSSRGLVPGDSPVPGLPGDRRSGRILLHIGRNAPEKNRAVLPALHRCLQDRQASWETWLVGSGGLSDVLTDEKGELPAGLHPLGERSDVERILAQADVLVLPSVREGQPGVVLEALASGVPVVASHLPTLEELAGRFDGIRLVDVQGSPDEWADAVCSAVTHHPVPNHEFPEQLQASEFGVDRVAARWEELFR